MAGQAGSGSESIIGIALETTQGTYVSPTNFIYCETNTLDWAALDTVKKKTMSGSRTSGRTKRTTWNKPEGSLSYQFYPTMGAKLLKAAFSADTLKAALTADTVKAATPVATAGGNSVITLTNTGAVTYVVGQEIVIGTGLSSEARPIMAISSNSAPNTVITVPQLVGNAAAAAGTAVQQIVAHSFNNSPTVQALPSLSVEDDQALLFAHRLAGVLVDKIDFKCAAEELTCTPTLVPTVKAAGPYAPTTPSLSADELSDARNPLTLVDAVFATYGDALGIGTKNTTLGGGMATVSLAGVQNMIGMESFEISYSNGLLKKPAANQSGIYRAWPGEVEATLKYTYINESKRQVEWEDIISAAPGTTTPFFASFYVNLSNTSTAKWYGVTFYMPLVVILKATKRVVAGDVIGMSVEAEPVPDAAQGNLLYVYLSNADSGQY